MTNILKFLSGKKGAIASIIGLIVTFCLAQGYISASVAELIGGISIIIFGTASYATGKLVYKAEQ
jgi:hypothetical protein